MAAPAAPPAITDPRYFVGANVPWINWGCDFGCGANGGASSSTVRATLAEGFGRLKAAGIHTVRWWVFEGDPAQITRDASGSPTGLNPAVYTDFDAALALADQFDLVYDFVLLSNPTAAPGGWVANANQRQHLADTLAPLFERYQNHPRILAWELFNEPEFDIWNNKIAAEPVQATVKLLAATAHAHTSTAVTLGSANLEGLPLWVGLGLDFYSAHWYDPMGSGTACARCNDTTTVTSRYHLGGLPIVVGEFYAGPDADALQRFKDLRAKGYAGAWAWSLFSDRTSDKMRIDLGPITAMAADPSPAPVPTPPTPASSIAPPATMQLVTNWVTPTYVAPGQLVTVYQDVLSAHETTVLVDFEVFNDAGQKVSQTALDNQVLSGDGVASFSTTFTLSPALPAGQYTVKTGLFGPGWGPMYAWSDFAGTFTLTPPLSPAELPQAP